MYLVGGRPFLFTYGIAFTISKSLFVTILKFLSVITTGLLEKIKIIRFCIFFYDYIAMVCVYVSMRDVRNDSS